MNPFKFQLLLTLLCLLGILQATTGHPFSSDDEANLDRRVAKSVAAAPAGKTSSPVAKPVAAAPAGQASGAAAKPPANTSPAPAGVAGKKGEQCTAKVSKTDQAVKNPNPPAQKINTRRDETTIPDEDLYFNGTFFDSNESNPLQKRIPFPNGVPVINPVTSANIYGRIHAIMTDPATANFPSNPYGPNSFLLRTDQDHQIGMVGGGLIGCTVVISFNADYIYASHLWEVPGFSRSLYNNDFPVARFATDVQGFLSGAYLFMAQPNQAPYPSLYSLAGNGRPYLRGARSVIFTLSANQAGGPPQYAQEIGIIGGLTRNLNGQNPQVVTYARPAAGESVRMTIEYSARRRELRILYTHTGTNIGFNVLHVAV